MKKIDGLLRIVSPELIKGYEAKNLSGRSLILVNEEYKAISAKRKKMIMTKPFFGFLLPFALVCWLVILGMTKAYNGSSIVAAGAPSVIAFIAWILIYWRTFDIAWGYNKTIAQCEEVLEEFNQSVEVLDPRAEMADFGYTPSNVKMWLVGHAIRLINAEKQFLVARFDKSVPAEHAFHFYSTEVNSRGLFEKALTAAEKFGLTFNNPDLFRDAEKYIAQTK